MGSRDVSSEVLSALEGATVRPFFAVEMLFDSAPIRLWTGTGTRTFGELEWIGAGTLLDISAVEETSEIAARGATITLGGLNTEVIGLALQSPYQGRVCNLYFGIMAEDGVSANLTQVFSGFMDEMNIEEGAEYGTIELKVENKLIDLERARVRRFSSAYQKSRYPDDKGFDFVEDLQDKEVVWGKRIKEATGSASLESLFGL